MEANFMFHNVGQGLFYSGQIKCDESKDFNFVYDCGGVARTPSSRSHTLDTCIKRHTTYLGGKNIDMLVISHFHNDHINGISELLAQNTVKQVIIPFYTFEERLSILLNENYESLEDDTIVFLISPYLFLLERGVERIIVMIHQENKEEITSDTRFQSLDDLENIIPKDTNEYAELREFESRITVIRDDKLLQKGCWNFAFYADDKHRSKFYIPTAKEGINDLKIAKNISDRKKAIKKIKSSYNISSNKSSLFNETSLIMVHKFNVSLRHIYPSPYTYYSKYYHFKCCHHFFREAENHVHILTGDFNFKTTSSWNKVKKHFGSFLNSDASVIQIAHHGSIDNWDKDILNHTSHSSLCVIPYGTKNTYGHPSINVIKDIVTSHNCLYEVTEYQSLILLYR